MSIFNPIKNQYAALEPFLSVMPAIDVQFAAQKMNVSPNKVQRSIEKMNKKNMFAPYSPYFDPETNMVVLDAAYKYFARAYHCADHIANELNRAQDLLIKQINDPSRVSKARSKIFRNFVKEFADSSFDRGMGNFIRTRGPEYLHSVLSPAGAAPEKNEEALMQLLQTLEDKNNAFLIFMREHTTLNYSSYISFLTTLDYQITILVKQLQSSALTRQETISMLERLEADHARKYGDLISALVKQAQPAQSREAALRQDLTARANRLKALSAQVTEKDMVSSLKLIAGLIEQIAGRLETGIGQASPSSLKSLRNCYLPMTDELLLKYMQSASVQSPQAKKARAEIENVFATVLPTAYRNILQDLENDSVVDMQSHADALVKKMQLDGLLPVNFGADGKSLI